MQKITDILKYVEPLEDGILKADEEKHIIELLQDGGWDELGGNCVEKTTSDKLYRAENMRLEKPYIKFDLERHGGYVNGSTRSDLHRWKIDLEKGTAGIESRSYRQTEPRDKNYNAKQHADEVSKEILNREDKEYLLWNVSKTECSIRISLLIPETVKQTTIGRRKRFRESLKNILESKGWRLTKTRPLSTFTKQ